MLHIFGETVLLLKTAIIIVIVGLAHLIIRR